MNKQKQLETKISGYYKESYECFWGIRWKIGASLVAQWLRISLPMQGTWVWALVWEDSHMPQSSWARAPQLLSPHPTTAEAHAPRARAPQQEKPPQWEAHAPQRRVAPARHS